MTATALPARTPARRRREAIAPLDFTRRRWLKAVLIANFVFLYFPIVALIAFTLNESKRNIPWQVFPFKDYEKAFNNTAFHDAFLNTITIASISTVVSTI